MNGWIRTFLIIAALALIFAVHKKQEEAKTHVGGAAVINFTKLLNQFPEYESVSDMKRSVADAAHALNINAEGPRVFFALDSEKNLFNDVSGMGLVVFNSLSEKAAMNKLDREFFEIKSDFGSRRDRIFDDSREKLDEAYRNASGLRPDSKFEKEKRRLFNLRIKLEVLNDDAFVMPEYRAADLREQMQSIEAMLEQAESAYTSKVTEQFRVGSEEVRAGLDEQLSKLELELQKELYDALSYSEQTLQSDAGVEHEKSDQVAHESVAARKRISSTLELIAGKGAEEDPFQTLDALSEQISDEYFRRLSRKAPAIAERGGYGLILTSDYAGYSRAEDISSKFIY